MEVRQRWFGAPPPLLSFFECGEGVFSLWREEAPKVLVASHKHVIILWYYGWRACAAAFRVSPDGGGKWAPCSRCSREECAFVQQHLARFILSTGSQWKRLLSCCFLCGGTCGGAFHVISREKTLLCMRGVNTLQGEEGAVRWPLRRCP